VSGRIFTSWNGSVTYTKADAERLIGDCVVETASTLSGGCNRADPERFFLEGSPNMIFLLQRELGDDPRPCTHRRLDNQAAPEDVRSLPHA
jgi:hypothetical protein